MPHQVVIVGASAAGLTAAETLRRRALTSLDAELLLGRAAVELDTTQRRVLLDRGASVRYDALIIATGVTPRRLPGTDLAGVHIPRTLDDALGLRSQLLGLPRVVVVGAGFLGAEVAAVACQASLDVTLLDPLRVPMHRQYGHRIGALIGRLHRDHGVMLATERK
jgi:3-phenylpropionate/trans-cinnamate dioxygenase ferredoxin reductase subunit